MIFSLRSRGLLDVYILGNNISFHPYISLNTVVYKILSLAGKLYLNSKPVITFYFAIKEFISRLQLFMSCLNSKFRCLLILWQTYVLPAAWEVQQQRFSRVLIPGKE